MQPHLFSSLFLSHRVDIDIKLFPRLLLRIIWPIPPVFHDILTIGERDICCNVGTRPLSHMCVLLADKRSKQSQFQGLLTHTQHAAPALAEGVGGAGLRGDHEADECSDDGGSRQSVGLF